MEIDFSAIGLQGVMVVSGYERLTINFFSDVQVQDFRKCIVVLNKTHAEAKNELITAQNQGKTIDDELFQKATTANPYVRINPNSQHIDLSGWNAELTSKYETLITFKGQTQFLSQVKNPDFALQESIVNRVSQVIKRIDDLKGAAGAQFLANKERALQLAKLTR